MPKFITVTPNPAIDRTYFVDKFAPADVNRATRVLAGAGGKGINVARVLRTLGSEAISTGFYGGIIGNEFKHLLSDEGLRHDFIDVSPQQTRLSILILDKASGKQTVVNEPGPSLNDDFMSRLKGHLLTLASAKDGIVFSGSLTPGMSNTAYRGLMEWAKGVVGLTLLDATGEQLLECIKAKPSILKINRNEALSLGVHIEDWDGQALDAAQKVRSEFGIDFVSITDGGNGAVLVGPNGKAWAQMPKVDVVSAVGSGDSFAAGLIHALATIPDDIEGALRLAAACGGANAQTEMPGVFGSEQIAALSGRIKLG